MARGNLHFTTTIAVDVDINAWIEQHGGDDSINEIRDSISNFTIDALNAWLIGQGLGDAYLKVPGAIVSPHHQQAEPFQHFQR